MSVRHLSIGHEASAKVVQGNGFGKLHAINADVELALDVTGEALHLREVHDDEISRGRVLWLRIGVPRDLEVHGVIQQRDCRLHHHGRHLKVIVGTVHLLHS